MTVYDHTDIPAAYDRGRDHGPHVLALWMQALSTYLQRPPARIVDLGCGTGRFSDALAVHFNADVIGLDPSFKMISQAAAKTHAGRVYYQLARAEAIPLRSGSIDAIFMSMSLHHFSDQQRAAGECRRVLADGGLLFIRTGTREQMPSYPYYPFIPATHPILAEVLPSVDHVRDLGDRAGFHMVAYELVNQVIAPNWETYADKLAAGSDSVLARLDRQDLEDGIAAVRRHGAGAPAQEVVEPIDLFVFRTRGISS